MNIRKKICYLAFLAAALMMGCTNTSSSLRSSYSYHQSHLDVIDASSRHKEYSLLSVRGDSELIVLDWQEAGIYPIPFSHAIVLTKDLIYEVDRIGDAKTGASIGSLSTEIVGVAWAISKETRGLFEGLGTMLAAVVSWLPGYIIGDLAGEIALPSHTFYLTSHENWEYLRSISVFPDKEPAIMQYIK